MSYTLRVVDNFVDEETNWMKPWLPVPLWLYNDFKDDPEKLVAEIYIRTLAHMNGRIITLGKASIARKLNWSYGKTNRFLARMEQEDMLVRDDLGRLTLNYEGVNLKSLGLDDECSA